MSDTAFKVHCGHDTNGQTFTSGLPVVKLTNNPNDPKDRTALVRGVYPSSLATVPRGRYVLWPVGELKRLIKYLEAFREETGR